MRLFKRNKHRHQYYSVSEEYIRPSGAAISGVSYHDPAYWAVAYGVTIHTGRCECGKVTQNIYRGDVRGKIE